MSVSRMRDSEAARFSVVTCRLLIIDSKRFWRAPSLPRVVDTPEMAVSRAVMAADRTGIRRDVEPPTPQGDRIARRRCCRPTVSPALAPIWKRATGASRRGRRRRSRPMRRRAACPCRRPGRRSGRRPGPTLRSSAPNRHRRSCADTRDLAGEACGGVARRRERSVDRALDRRRPAARTGDRPAIARQVDGDAHRCRRC